MPWPTAHPISQAAAPPGDAIPLPPIPKAVKNASAAAALASFRIGYFATANGNQLRRGQVLVYNEQTDKLEFMEGQGDEFW